MTDARADLPSRRSVLTGGGLLLLTACTGSSAVRAPALTADQRLARRVAADIADLVAAYAATIAAHPRTGALLAPLAAEHRAHLAALADLQPPPVTASPSASAGTSATPSTSPPAVANDRADARRELARAEDAAAARRGRQAGAAGPELARLLASIAACESVHAVLVAP